MSERQKTDWGFVFGVAFWVVAGVALIAVACVRSVRAADRDREASARREAEEVEAIAKEGRKAGLDGVPCEACPYSQGADSYSQRRRAAWLKGWAEGYLERAKEAGR